MNRALGFRLNWARRISWGWWDDTFLQTQDSKFEPWRSEAEHATSRSRRLSIILTFTRGWGRNIFCFFQTAETGNRTPNSGVKALTTTLGPPALRRSNFVSTTRPGFNHHVHPVVYFSVSLPRLFTNERGRNIWFHWNLIARAGEEPVISEFPSTHIYPQHCAPAQDGHGKSRLERVTRPPYWCVHASNKENQWWLNVGPSSSTLAQHSPIFVSVTDVCWDLVITPRNGAFYNHIDPTPVIDDLICKLFTWEWRLDVEAL